MVLLGNDEPVGYTNLGKQNPALDTSLRQGVEQGTADTLNAFLERCGQVSVRQCAFSAGSATATKAKWRRLLDNLRFAPVTAGGVKYDYGLVVTLTIVSLYEVSPGFIGFDWEWLGKLLQGALSVRERPTPNDYPAFPDAVPGGQRASATARHRTCAEAPNPRDTQSLFRACQPQATKSVPVLSAHTGYGVTSSAPQWPAKAAAAI
jgi:hypothetical protein